MQVINARNLNYELPYNGWLYELTVRKLSAQGFCVEAKNPEEPVVAANEFTFSKSD